MCATFFGPYSGHPQACQYKNLSAGEHRSTNTLNYFMVQNLQIESEEETL